MKSNLKTAESKKRYGPMSHVQQMHFMIIPYTIIIIKTIYLLFFARVATKKFTLLMISTKLV